MKKLFFLIIVTILTLIACIESNRFDAERQWPGYRGYFARGSLDEANLPESWMVSR